MHSLRRTVRRLTVRPAAMRAVPRAKTAVQRETERVVLRMTVRHVPEETAVRLPAAETVRREIVRHVLMEKNPGRKIRLDAETEDRPVRTVVPDRLPRMRTTAAAAVRVPITEEAENPTDTDRPARIPSILGSRNRDVTQTEKRKIKTKMTAGTIDLMMIAVPAIVRIRAAVSSPECRKRSRNR